MRQILLLVFRIASYFALVSVLLAVAAMTFINVSGVCPRFDEGAIHCSSPIYETIGGIGLFVALMSAFTGVPLILAVAGLVFLVRDIVATMRRTSPTSPSR